MLCNNVHKAPYQTCEIHVPYVRGAGPRIGLIWPYSKTTMLRKSSSLIYIYIYIFEKKNHNKNIYVFNACVYFFFLF